MKIGNLVIQKSNCGLILFKLLLKDKIIGINFFINKKCSYGYYEEKESECSLITTWGFSPLFSVTNYNKK
jgi:hypothetical protein